ncbi:MAG: response regulator transcription factor, partial [Candidatus Eisenbacteria sp.]|nr:response regulator transcription factor [Candidatus Eisenbacteria bacterium]
MKILVVDDDLELLNLIAFALRQAGYLVVETPDGRAALDALEKETPDLIILDYNLPRMSGLEVLKTVRAGGNTTPVMMLTVRSAEEDQVRALDQGADDYLTKPFSPRTLLARIRALLRRAGIEKPSPLVSGELAVDA